MEPDTNKSDAFDSDPPDRDPVLGQPESQPDEAESTEFSDSDSQSADSDDERLKSYDSMDRDYSEFDAQMEDLGLQGSAHKKRRMFCFGCNRTENFVLYVRMRWFYSYLLGLTFGLVLLIGPYQCQCCGSRRLMCNNYLSPKYLFLKRGVVRSKKSSKRSSKSE